MNDSLLLFSSMTTMIFNICTIRGCGFRPGQTSENAYINSINAGFHQWCVWLSCELTPRGKFQRRVVQGISFVIKLESSCVFVFLLK